jgi:hypothetical protein
MHSTPSILMRRNERLTFATFMCSVLAIVSLSLTVLHIYVSAALIITSFVVHALIMLLRGYRIAGRRPQKFLLTEIVSARGPQ